MNLNDCPAQELTALFDEYGRCLPAHISAPVHQKSRRYFRLQQPHIDHEAIHARVTRHLGATGVKADDFRQRSEALLQRLRNDPLTRGITEGVCVPFLLPQASHTDYGDALEHIYIKAVCDAFQEQFPQYRFTDHHKDGLSGRINLTAGSRHERLVQAMQQGPVVGYYFPCLTEYSVPAMVERMATLPDCFLLAGGYDTSAALIGTPGLMQRADGYPPLLWLAGLQTEKPEVGYYYEAYGYNLTFNRRPHFGQAAEYWASGLVVVG